MSLYKSKVYEVESATQEQIFNKLSNPGALTEKIENLPDAVKEKLDAVKFGPDSITLNVPPVGELKMVLSEKVAPSKIVISPESSPVPFGMIIDIATAENGKATIAAGLNIELNPFLLQMVGNKLEEGVDGIAKMLAKLPFAD